MNFQIQLKGLNDLLGIMYGSGVQLEGLLRDLGFEQARVEQLSGASLEAVVAGLLESLHRRLTSDSGLDTYYQVLSRHYGLDGEPPHSLDEIAQSRRMDREELALLWRTILERCKTQAAQKEMSRDLKQLAVAQLARSAERPDREHVAAKLERLSNLREAADAARLDYEARRAEVLKKVQAELDALEVEYQPLLESVKENMEELENEIRTDVLLHGESVSGGAYRAIYMKGRISWDSRGMEKYAEQHPEVLKFRKEGAPNVALRITGEKD